MVTKREVFYGVISQEVALFFNMEDKICSFFGHRNIEVTEELYTMTAAEIRKSVDFGCRVFYFGGYGEFDELCYKIVTKMQKETPSLGVKRVYCVSQERYLRKKVRYFTPENYEEIIYLTPSFDYWYKSIYFRNCAMIDKSSYIIFYAEQRENSGAYKAYKYAKTKKDKYIVNLIKP